MTKIYEAKNHILIHTGYDAPAEHCHMAAHIIISMEDAMTVRVEDAEYVCRGIMIPSGVSHRIDTRGKAVLAFLYDGTTNISQQIKDVKTISAEKCMDIITAYVDFEKQEGAVAYAKFEREMLKRLELSEIDDGIKDERILSAMEYIRRKASEKITCRDVAEAVFLSESRFSHLFKEQVGMTFSAYLIYPEDHEGVYTGFGWKIYHRGGVSGRIFRKQPFCGCESTSIWIVCKKYHRRHDF